ncbi:MAG: cell division protein SepF [Clostridia bacterium]
MKKNLFNRMADLVFGDTDVEDDFEEVNFAEEEPIVETPRRTTSSSAKKSANQPKVVNFAATTQLKVVVLKMNAFDESCRQVVDNLNNNKPVIINIEDMDRDQARRTIDFISGAAYARRGSFRKISDGILLLAPSNVDVTPAVKSELESGRPFPWD